MIFYRKKKKIDDYNRIKASFFGFFVGDALGVPVEFQSRKSLKNNRVESMLEFGTHYQPVGTWSDDSSMVLATTDSLITKRKIDYYDIMNNFLKWFDNAEYTPHHKVFDIGNATSMALLNYKKDKTNIKCGSTDIYSNGNGSLMRMLPISLYIHYTKEDLLTNVEKISSMTHAHKYSIYSCIIYTVLISEYLNVYNLKKAYHNMQEKIKTLLSNKEDLQKVFSRIIYHDISKYKEDEIKSSGYVIDSLEASIWCLLKTNNYKDAVLKAVNLGEDTDTIGAITGSLAGLVYGIDDIPTEWLNLLQRKDYLEKIVNDYLKLIQEKITFNE